MLDELPAWRTPAELNQHYVVTPPWWYRGLLYGLGLALAALMIVLIWHGQSGFGIVRRVLAIVLGGGLTLAILGWIAHDLKRELKNRAQRDEIVASIFANLQKAHVPVWALFVGKIRLGDRMSAPNDTPDDLIFVFDLRAPPQVLRRQRAIATAWVDTVAGRQRTNVPEDLGAAFAGRSSVHCAEVFGDHMHGVWMWRKPSLLPFYVLGLALDDPQTAEEFTDETVFFTRRPPMALRQQSRIAKI